MNILSSIANTHSIGQTTTSSSNNMKEKVEESQSSIVTLSEDAIRASQSGASEKGVRMLDVFVTTPRRLPPQPSSALEEMVYARGGQQIDFTKSPPTWPSDDKALNYDDWLKYEKELDKQTDDRIDIYERSVLAGLSKEEIVSEIKKYNETLHPRYIHNASVEERPNDIERPLYEKPPTGSKRPEVMDQRQNDYANMVTGMTRGFNEIMKYLA